MKKIIAVSLALILCLAMMAGCGSDNSGAAANTAAKTAPAVDINNGAECKMAYIPMGAGQEDYPIILKGMQEAITLYPQRFPRDL